MTLVAESVIEVATGVGAGGVGGTGGVVGELPPSPQELRSTAHTNSVTIERLSARVND